MAMSQQFPPPVNRYTGSFTEDAEGDESVGTRLDMKTRMLHLTRCRRTDVCWYRRLGGVRHVGVRDVVSPIVMPRRVTPANRPLQHLEAGRLGASTPQHVGSRPAVPDLCIGQLQSCLLTALSYSDLVKSWRGECGGIGIGPYCMYSLPYVYVCVCARRPRQGHCKCT